MLPLLGRRWRASAPLIKRLTTSPPPAAAPSLTLHFLQHSCSLSPEAALAVSKKINLKTTKKPHAVLSLLKSHSFSPSDIASIVSRVPKLLLSDPEKTLAPKLQFFLSLGLSRSDLLPPLLSNPSLLLFSLPNRILPNLNLLTSLLPASTPAHAFKTFPSCLVADLTSLLPQMASLQRHGVPAPAVLKLLTSRPRSLSSPLRPVPDLLSFLRDTLRIGPSSVIFPHAYGVLAKLSKRDWDRKAAFLAALGWSEQQLVSAFAKHPYFMTASTEKLGRNMGFFVEELGWDAGYVAGYPVVLSLSFEKRIAPRCRVLGVLRSEGLFDGRVAARLLMLGKEEFRRRYVTKFRDRVPRVVDAIEGRIGKQCEGGDQHSE